MMVAYICIRISFSTYTCFASTRLLGGGAMGLLVTDFRLTSQEQSPFGNENDLTFLIFTTTDLCPVPVCVHSRLRLEVRNLESL